LLGFANRAPSLWNFGAPICLCPENIGEVQYGQSTSNQNPMVVRPLDIEKDVFRPQEEGEEISVSSEH
jgi:hypothetical protein